LPYGDGVTGVVVREGVGRADPATLRTETRTPAFELGDTTSMFGRSVEQAELIAALNDPSARLVTLTGRGGVGKTRLALEVIRVSGEQGGPPCVAVSLAGTPRPELVIGEVAAALGVPVLPNVDLVDTVADRVQGDELLVLLDNFEHLLASAPVLSDLLQRCGGLRFLVTSQSPLRLRCERVLALDPLRVPGEGDNDPVALAELDAVAIYCARARAVERRFELDANNARAIAELCRRLEGLPLAIELAAARAAALPAAEILRRLDTTGLDVLHRERGDAPARHHDLHAAIDWTYRLLSPEEQCLLRRLSLISGTFDVDTVEALGRPAASGEVLDQLTALVDLHLVDPLSISESARFQIASSIRVFCREQLEQLGEYDATRRMHISLRAGTGRAATEGIASADDAAWLERLTADHDDLIAALDAALDAELADEAIDIAAGLAPLWEARGYAAAYEKLLERTVQLGARSGAATIAHANVLLWSGLLGLRHHTAVERTELVDRIRRGEELARARHDDRTVLRALTHWMRAMPYTGDLERAHAASSEGLELATRTGEDRWLGTIEALSGMLAQQSGDDERAIALGRAAVARARRNGDPRTLVLATMLLIPLRRKHPDIAIDMPTTGEALDCARATGLTLYAAVLLPIMTGEALAAGDRSAALRSAIASLTIARGMADSTVVGYTLMTMSSVAALCADAEAAAYFHGIVRDQITALTKSLAPQQLLQYE
jgi:predicted ATPase